MRSIADWASLEPETAGGRRPPIRTWLQAAVRRLGSGALLRALLFIAVFSLAAVPPLDPDLWWHLSNGRLMVAMGSIPHADVYSFSAAGQPWVMHEWLADLGMFGLYQLGGLTLLVGVFALVVALAAGCLYWLLRRAGLDPAAAVVLTLVGSLAGSTAWGARPQLLNLLFAGLLLVGLRRYREGGLAPWLLPPFIWLWANLHSGFVVGLIITGIVLVGEGFDAWRRQPNAMSRSRLQALALALGLCLPLSLINPFGIQSLLFALGTLTSPLIQNNIQEWASPDFHSLPGLLFEGTIFVMLAGLATRKVGARAADWLLALALLYLALSSQRHVPLFMLGAAAILGRCGQALLEAGSGRKQVMPFRRPRARLSLAQGMLNLILLLVVGAGMVAYRALPNLQPATEQAAVRSVFPVSAAAELRRLGPVRVFNYYDYGGYLVWTLYPGGSRVYIDGRVEVYGSRVFSEYLRVSYLGDGWESVLDRAHPDAIILPSGHPLVHLLDHDHGWQRFSHDSVATVFTRVGFAP